MQQMATDIWRLASWRPLINVYLAGDVLIDAGRARMASESSLSSTRVRSSSWR